MQFTSTIGKAGLSCETMAGAYWIWVTKDGQVIREVNCRPVEEFPANARKAKSMEKLFETLKGQMLEYLNATDTVAGTKTWWAIKDTVKAVAE